MDVLILLTVARDAGLTVTADGDRLVMRGPRAAEHLVHALAARKAEVMAALRSTPAAPEADFQTERSRLFLADAPAFFQGWRRDADGWHAPWSRN
jgi:hypothetical protein